MPTSSLPPAERSRATVSLVLQAFSEPGKASNIATLVGVSESTISCFKTQDLEMVAKILAFLGLKVVRADAMCMDPEKLSAILTLAKAHLASVRTVDQLDWSEP